MDYGLLIGIIGFVIMFALILIGAPIFISLMIASVFGFWMLSGSSFCFVQFTNAAYNVTASFTFAVVPMFILMGIIAGESGLAEAAYYAAKAWMGKLRGGVLITTIFANTIFGAISGVSLGSTAMFTKLSLPELDKLGYDKRTSAACIATAGVLVNLIPPSVSVLIFCVIVNLSIGKALVAGIVPGIITTFVLSGTVLVLAKLRPQKFPVDKTLHFTTKQKFVSLYKIWPIFLVFILVIGGIYGGFFSSTVGGAVGAFVILLYGLISRNLNWVKTRRALWDSAIMSAQIFPLVLGGYIFSRYISLSGLTDLMMNWIVTLNVHPLIIMLVVLIFYIIMGAIMDIMAILIITLPVIFPLLVSLGFESYSLVVILIFMVSIAGLTPPIGMSVFVVAAAAKMDSSEVFRGIIPFFLAEMLVVILLVFLPEIATWLPNLMYQ